HPLCGAVHATEVAIALTSLANAARRILGFALQLEIARETTRVEAARRDGCCDFAAFVAVVTAVAEATFSRQRLDVIEHLAHAGIDRTDPQLAHSRRVHDPRTAWQGEHLPRGRRVSSPGVVLTNAGCPLLVGAHERVEQRRLADA